MPVRAAPKVCVIGVAGDSPRAFPGLLDCRWHEPRRACRRAGRHVTIWYATEIARARIIEARLGVTITTWRAMSKNQNDRFDAE